MALKPVFDGQLKPTMFCIGTVASVDQAKISEKGYLSAKVNLLPVGTGRKAMTWVVIGPNFLNASFKPQGFQATMYAENINRHTGKDLYHGFAPGTNPRGQYVGLALLPGLCGSKDVWDEFATKLEQISIDNDHQFSDEFLESFDELMQTLVGNKVGYVLKQQWEASDELNEKGFPVKVPGQFMEVAGMFYLDDETFDKINEAIERWNNTNPAVRAVKLFDETIPFDSYGATEE